MYTPVGTRHIRSNLDVQNGSPVTRGTHCMLPVSFPCGAGGFNAPLQPKTCSSHEHSKVQKQLEDLLQGGFAATVENGVVEGKSDVHFVRCTFGQITEWTGVLNRIGRGRVSDHET